jgi:hypothetical protein
VNWISTLQSWWRRRQVSRLALRMTRGSPSAQLRAVSRLRKLLQTGDADTTDEVIARVEQALNDPRESVRWNAINVLVEIAPEERPGWEQRFQVSFVGGEPPGSRNDRPS